MKVLVIVKDRKFIHYTSASLTTKKKFEFTYGRVEVRAKMPRGKGMWPAIWTLGSTIGAVGWPRCGEIDIMEYVGKEPNRDADNTLSMQWRPQFTKDFTTREKRLREI